MPSNNIATVCVFSHTHWDREWYRSFEAYRFRLEQAMAVILDSMEHGDLSHFLLDGQTVILDDYLDLHPEGEIQIRYLIESKRLSVGPWYILPDEFLVSGESLVRNLLIGIERATELGQTQFIGYLPDMFGHIAQMPQILLQSHLSPAIVWRGVSPTQSVFNWEALNGSHIDTVHLTKGYYQDHFFNDNLDMNSLTSWLTDIQAASPVQDWLLLPNGGDHLALAADFTEKMQDYNQSQTQFLLQAVSLRKYITGLHQHHFKKETIRGELRHTGSTYILSGTLSSRIYLKQENARMQTQLEKMVEPLAALTWLETGSYPKPFIRKAWKYLLLNQPHDSICGCSIDEVHQEMMTRYLNCRQISQELLSSFRQKLFQESDGEYLHFVNMTPYPYQGYIRFSIQHESERFIPSLFDLHGKEIPFDVLQTEQASIFEAEIDVLPHWKERNCTHGISWLELPPFSSHVLQIRGQKAQKLPLEVHDGNLRQIGQQELSVRVEPDGQLAFISHGKCVLRGHLFLDGGDAGDSYNYSPPIHDRQQLFQLMGMEKESFRSLEKLHLTYQAFIPTGLGLDRKGRTKETRSYQIQTEIALYTGDSKIRFHTRIENVAQDHRLQLIFIPETDAVTYEAGTQFGALPRTMSFGHPYDVPKGQERIPETFPFQEWIRMIYPESWERGLAFFFEGLYEGSLRPWDEKPALAVTCLRSIGWLSRDDLRTRGGGAGPAIPTEEAQCLGRYDYHYSIDFDCLTRAALVKRLQQWQQPPLVIQADVPFEKTWFDFHGSPLYISAFKRCEQENALILRCVNLLDKPLTATITPLFSCQDISLSNCLEETLRSERLQVNESTLSINLVAQEIVSFKFFPNPSDKGGSGYRESMKSKG